MQGVKKRGSVYIVCAIDAEGPIDNPQKPDILNNWDKIGDLMGHLTDDSFRLSCSDSAGNGLVYSLFILTLTGFKTNPFNRPMAYNVVYDYYLDNFGKTFLEHDDGIYWHYHQPAPSGIGNEWCRDWAHCTEYFNILSRLLLDRGFFPSCFRAGGRIEDEDLSHWLEQWIPFDFSSCSGDVNWNNIESDGKRLIEVCDWSRAPCEWEGYHPSRDDYQARGDMKRWIFRCPDIESPVHRLSEKDILSAFEQAEQGNDAVLAFFEHDRRQNTIDKILNRCCRQIYEVSKKYKDVKWYYKNARESAVLSLEIENSKAPEFNVEIRPDNRIYVESANDIFGQSPFLCVISEDKYQNLPLHIIGKNKWLSSYVKISEVTRIGVAANSQSGNPGVHLYSYEAHDNILALLD